ncbi:MAG: MBOAT family protein, partial [Planctomycetales bacterium]|nr:MBOAT family protein [Planctomycetales bacterium]
SYTIDVYRRRMPATRDLLSFSLFVAFFPQLVAGPIERAKQLLPQIEAPRRITAGAVEAGLWLLVWGYFKKTVIADQAALVANPIFAGWQGAHGLEPLLGVLGFTVHIYCDFSGYSDMAIGTARMIGFHFSENFRLPYLSVSITEFWRRWHISLSSWLRDYLYIPLGGNRLGRVRTYVNLILTMLLGGLWHGASWNFAVWGLLHGGALSLHRRWRGRGEPIEQAASPVWYRLASWATTMLVVTGGWVLFRAASWHEAALIFRQLLAAQPGFHHVSPFALLVVAGFMVHHGLIVSRWTESLRLPLELPLSSRLTPAALFTMLLLTLLHWPQAYQPFIYFQF